MKKSNTILFVSIIVIGLLGIASIYITNKKESSRKAEDVINQVKESKGYQLLYIGATGCEPCEFQESQLETLISNYKFGFYYLDLGDLSDKKVSEVLLKSGIKEGTFSTPSLIVYNNGKLVDVLSGLSPINTIFDFFKKNSILSEEQELNVNYLDLDSYLSTIESDEPQVIALGSISSEASNYAQQVLWEISKDVKINYLQLSSLSEKEGSIFEDSLDYFSQNQVDIPMLLIVKNKSVIASTLENLDKEGYINFLKENNIM